MRIAVTRPPVRAMRKTAAVAPSAPTKALTDRALAPSPEATPNAIVSAAPVVAPEVTPSRYGSARTLRTIACSATPAIASPAPTTTPSSTRGIRMSQMIASSEESHVTACGQSKR